MDCSMIRAAAYWPFFILLALAACRGGNPREERGGELVWNQRYPNSAAIRVPTAERSFRDAEGRIVKTIWYDVSPDASQHRNADVMYSEGDLRVLFSQQHKYDEKGREVEIEYDRPHSFNGNARRQQIVRNEDGSIVKRVYFDGKGIRLHEARGAVDSPRQTLIRFDATGDKVVSIRGPLPDSIDLAHGWGEPIDGVSCGIAPTQTRGRPADIQIHVVVKNETDHPQAICYAYPFVTLHFELRDSEGKVIAAPEEVRAKYSHWLRTPPDRYPTDELAPRSAIGRLGWPPGCIETWYGRIKPGTYTLRVRLLHREPDVFLISNTITIEIE